MPTCSADAPLPVAEQHALICQWSGLAVRVARQLAYRRDVAALGLSEAVSAGYVGLVKAAAAYDPSRGSFPGFAWRLIAQAVLAEAREWSRRGADLSLDAEIGRSGLTLGEEVPAAEQPDGADRLDVAGALATLPEREKSVITRRYGLDGGAGAVLRQVGTETGISGSRVGQLERRGLKRLRALLA